MSSITTPQSMIASAVGSGRYAGKLIVADLSSPARVRQKGRSDITSLVTNLNVSYTMDMASQLSFEIVDPLNMSTIDTLFHNGGDGSFTLNNYFIPGRDIIYETETIGSIDADGSSVVNVRQLFEISDVTFQQGPGVSPTYSVQCYTKAIQQMKRDRNPSAIKGSGTSFVYNAAKKYGLRFFGEQTSKKQTITKATGSRQAESLWTVIDRLAGEAKFVCFETNGVLVFASEKYLLNKWGPDIIGAIAKKKTKANTKSNTKYIRGFTACFPSRENDILQLHQFPTIRRSANDAYEGNGSIVVDRKNGTQLRPGMTLTIIGIPFFSGHYLITDVSFDDMSANPVSVNFRTPTRDEEKTPAKDLKIGQKVQQTYTSRTSRLRVENVIDSAKTSSGKTLQAPWLKDARLRPVPTAEDPYSYPRMAKANLTKIYDKLAIFNKNDSSSTLEVNTLIAEGNLDLWDRPVLLDNNNNVKTLNSITHVVTSSSPFICVLLPTIYTEDNAPVEKTEDQVIAKYTSDGGYAGSAKHLGVITGSTRNKAITNARDYAMLLHWQQELVMNKRFSSNETIIDTPGGADSEW